MEDDERDYLLGHRCHDYDAVAERWRAVADRCGLRMEVVATAADYPIYALANGREPTRERGLYLSAGVHGDEPGAVEGLLAWAENPEEESFLREYPVVLFPCLNPAGLVENTRLDHLGRDLNRIFDDGSLSPVREWQAWIAKKKFRLALCLHEDYDAQGAYVYELVRGGGKGIGDGLLRACDAILPRLPGDGVEGRAAEGGVVRPDGEIDIDEVLEEIQGMPEAIHLYLHHTDQSLTFETPSEYSLYDRVRAQVAVLKAAVRLMGA